MCDENDEVGMYVQYSPRLMQLLQSHTPSMSVSQTVRGDMPSDARVGSDDEESHNGTRSSAYVVHPADVHPTMSEPAVRTTGMHSRPVQTGPVCTTPGLCQAGGELRLTHLGGKSVQVSEGFVLVGAKSPMLPGMMLVAEVDRRFLPDEKNNVTMLGFSGNCIGCGAKGFRYFTEFSSHINLKLATQPKKQKHLKYYIVSEPGGRVRKGPAIPWKVEGRKRTFPLTGPYIPVPYSTANTEITSEMSRTSVTSAPLHLLSLQQSHSSAIQGQSMVSPRDEGVLLMQSTNQNTPEQTYHPGLSIKRRRWESAGSESPIESDDGHSSDTARSAPGSDASELPSDPWLTTACGVRPVLLLCQHSIPKIPCSVEDIIISDLLVGCFDPPLVSDRNQFGNISGVYSTAPASSADRSFYGNVPCLTTQMAVLLMVQYLSQFVDDDRISREDVESLLQDARLELTASVQQQSHLLAQSNAVTHVQLPVLASLTAANSKGRVKIVSSPVSLDNAIFRALKFVLEIHRHNQSKFPKVPVPDFIFVLATSQKKSPEFCLLITSVLQAKYLSEAMIGHPVGARIADNLSRLEQLFKLSSDALEQMISNFEEAMGQGQLVFVPFNGFARTKVMTDEAARLEPRAAASSYPHQKQTLFASQHLMAKQLLAQVCAIGENITSLDLNSFTAVSTAIIVPPLTTLFNQTTQRLCKCGLLAELDLECPDKAGLCKTAAKYVIKHSGMDETQEELLKLLEQVQSQPKVLFVVVFDQAQFFASPQGVLDLPYYKEFLEARNVIALFVTATPYLFQTNCSFIDPNNEVYWSDVRTETDGVSISVVENFHNLETNEGTYFGMKEYCESIKWTHQFPLVRQDDAFEKMALRTSRTTDDVNLSVLRCYLLIRHYCAAIMWSAGIKPAEPHCTLKTIQIMREIIESPVHNADGSGAMLVIRIPSVELANLAFESLKNTRDRLGFQFRFAIIHDNGLSELEIEDYFLKRLRVWRDQRVPTKTKSKSSERWSPKCFEDLHDLPCIIIVSGRERPGDTFPRSLKYIDLRLIDRGFVYRSSLELEFSAIACYIGSGTGSRGVEGSESNGPASGEAKDDSTTSSGTVCRTSHYSTNYPLPVILVSRSVFKAFQSDFYGYPKHLLLPTTPQTRWVGLGRPPVVTSNPRHQSLYYREWTEPKPKQVPGPQQDASNRQAVITLRSASGVVISPDITDVVEEDGMSAVECFTESNRMASGTSEGEDSSCEDSKPGVENGAAKKTIRDSNATAKHGHQQVFGPALLHRLYGMAASTRQDTSAGETGVDSSSRNGAEPARTEKYHPRSILFSGPPQVGKTHAYLHFIRLLHQTVQKLRRVDVYNETVCTPEESSLQTTPVPSGSEQERMAWPVYKEVSKLPFSCLLREHRYSKTSKLRIHASSGCTVSGETSALSVKRSPGRPTCPMMLSCWAAYDTYHHCDSCKNYREGMGPNTSLSYMYTLQCGEKLHFIIPHRCLQSFTFTKEKQLRSLRLPVVLTGGSGEVVKPLKSESGDGEAAGVVRSPIMMPSTGRHEYGLLNLYHAMEGESHTLLVFVKHQEMALYHKAWPNHVIVGLPVSADTQGLGAARFYIKEFATESWLTERDRHAIHGKRGQDVWPFIFMMDDSCVMWQNLLKQTVNKDESSTKDTDKPSCVMTSLLKVLQHLENTPDLMSYGMLGLQQYSADVSTPVTQGSFSHCPLHTSIMMNLGTLQGIKYNPYRYWWEDVNMSLQVLAGGIHSCRFNHLVVAKKFIETGGATAFKEEPANSTEGSSHNKELLPGDKLVTAPDREDAPYLSVPAYYLLERYLELTGAARLFPEAEDKPDHPVLVVDCYVNLGPRVCLEFVSSHGWDKSKKNDKQDTRYGGLLLYFCGRSVSAAFLSQFKFAPRSRLCLVCQDRNTLRQEVARLDLEEHWRFRLRDEFQTANSPDEPSLYFLTGQHDD
ncbi:GREB1-like protein isoform X2 [Oculina patagonica]